MGLRATNNRRRRRDEMYLPLDPAYLEEEPIPDYTLEEGIPEEDLYRDIPREEPEDLLERAGDIERRNLPAIDRRYGASRGSALAGQRKTQGYTPSENETFTFENTGQMVVPSGEKVEDFAPGVREALKKLERRGPDPRGTRRPSQGTASERSQLPPATPPRTQPTKDDESRPPVPALDRRFTRRDRPEEEVSGELPPELREWPQFDERYLQQDEETYEPDIDTSGLGEPLPSMPPIPEEGEGEEGAGGELPLPGVPPGLGEGEEGAGGELPLPGVPPGLGEGAGVGRDQYRAVGEEPLIPQEQREAETMRSTYNILDPRYSAQLPGRLEDIEEAKRKGLENLEDAIGRQFGEEGAEAAKQFAQGREAALDAYLEGMDKESRKAFIDSLLGNIGKIIAGGIGLDKGLNVAKYYEYEPYDVAGGREAERQKYNAAMRLQKELEQAERQGKTDEVQAYQTLANFRRTMSNDAMNQLLQVLDLTKTSKQLGADVSKLSFFQPKVLQAIASMEGKRQMQFLQMANNYLSSMVRSRAAEQAAKGKGSGLVRQDIRAPNREEIKEVADAATSILRKSGLAEGLQTPEEIYEGLGRIMRKPYIREAISGNKLAKMEGQHMLVLSELRRKLKPLIGSGKKINALDFFNSEVFADPESRRKMGMSPGVKRTIRDPATGRVISTQEIYQDEQQPEARLVPKPPDFLTQYGGRGESRQQQQPEQKRRIQLRARDKQLFDMEAGQPIETRDQLEQILQEEAETGVKYTDEIFDYLR